MSWLNFFLSLRPARFLRRRICDRSALRTDAGPPAEDFPVNVSEHPAAPSHFFFCARLLDIITDDNGNLAETPHIDYALIEQERLSMFLQERGDLLIACRQGAGCRNIDQFRRKHQFQRVLISLIDRFTPAIFNLLKPLLIPEQRYLTC